MQEQNKWFEKSKPGSSNISTLIIMGKK